MVGSNAAGRGAGDLVGQFVERVADRQLGRDARDREAGRLGSQRRRTADARVHLDHDQPAGLGIDCELHVRTTCFHTDFAQHGDARRAHDLVFLVGQGQRRGDGDRIAGVDPHRVDILDRADDDAVVRPVADDFHLVLFPAEQRFLDQHFGGRAGVEPFAHDPLEFGLVVGDPAAGAAQGKAWADDRREAGSFQHFKGLLDSIGNPAACAFEPDPVHRLAEALAVFRLVDRIGVGADHLHAEPLQRAIVEQRERGVERGLPAHRRQQRVGPLLLDDLGDDLGRDRLDVGGVGELGIGHDRGGVGVDQDHPVPLLLQRLDRLRARIIELARLPDDDRPGADDEDRGDVSAFGHYCISVDNWIAIGIDFDARKLLRF